MKKAKIYGPILLVFIALFTTRSWGSPPPASLALLAELKSSILGAIQLQSPPGAWVTGQPTRLAVTQSAETAQDFDTTFTGDRKTQKRLPGEVRIQAGKSRPRSDVSVRWILPAQVDLGTAPFVMAQFLYDSETESHDYFTKIPASYNSATRELIAKIDPKYFTDERNDTGQFEAILVVVTDHQKK